ncbi:MAG: phenylalanine--tRNA ligase subunit beta [Candidatus Limnocylindrales bacterium]
MRVPISWLRDYVDIDLSPDELAERLTLLGMEVKGVERRGTDWQGVVVGELLVVEPHPNADRLSLTKVRVAEGGEVLSIVCGATNIAPGQKVPVALPGAVLPGGRAIERTAKMGVVSEGMLCSGDELRLTADAEGILILPSSSTLGARLSDVYGDVVLDVDVKPNRGDALSLIGLAREVAAATGAALRWPRISVPETGDVTDDHLAVEVQDRGLCPRFVGRWIDGVTTTPSPLEVQLRLMAAGMRPVSNVVDASNYVMLELGKPIHTFDAASVPGGRIVVRLARAGERLETLDHVVRALTPDTLLIAGTEGPLGIAGVLGGAASEIGPSTSSVIVESAIFDPVSIRRTGQRYGLRSEASLRFEKGQEHRLALVGADRTAQLISAWGGGRVARGVVDTDAREVEPARIPFRPARARRLLGVDMPTAEQRSLLERVGITTEAAGGDDELIAVVPEHRRDITAEADLIEEIVRVRGYETVPARLPASAQPRYRTDPRRDVDHVRDLLAGRGLNEVITHALIGPDDHGRLGIMADDPATIRASNPVSIEHSQLRRSLLPGLLGALVQNERQRRTDVALFEIGAVHRFEGQTPVETLQLSVLLAGDWVEGAWDQPARAAEIADAVGLGAALAERFHAGRLGSGPKEPWPGVEHPGRVASLRLGDGPAIGAAGELDPRLLDAWGARAPRAVFATIDLAPFLGAIPAALRTVALPRAPAAERDIAVVVAANVPVGAVEAAIRAAAGPVLRDVRLFDRYRGAPLAPDQTSLAYRLSLQGEQTLTDAQIDAVLDRVVAALAGAVGARLRG